MKNFMLLILFASSLALVSFVLSSKPSNVETTIQFTDQSWDAVLQLAKEQNKLIFLDIYASWCGPCKMLKKYTFTDEEVGKYFNDNFINVTEDAERGEGRLLASKYEIRAYPTLLFINSDGTIRKKVVGYRDGKQLLNDAKRASDQ